MSAEEIMMPPESLSALVIKEVERARGEALSAIGVNIVSNPYVPKGEAWLVDPLRLELPRPKLRIEDELTADGYEARLSLRFMLPPPPYVILTNLAASSEVFINTRPRRRKNLARKVWGTRYARA